MSLTVCSGEGRGNGEGEGWESCVWERRFGGVNSKVDLRPWESFLKRARGFNWAWAASPKCDHRAIPGVLPGRRG